MSVKTAFFVLLILGLSFVRCTENLNKRVKKNTYVIAEDTLTNVLFDIALLEGYLRNTSMAAKEKNRRGTRLYLGILDTYKISTQRLDSSFLYYRDHLDDWEAILDKVQERLEQKEKEYKLPAGDSSGQE